MTAGAASTTIPRAAARRPLLVAVVVLAGLALGASAGLAGGTSFRSTAMVVVNSPTTDNVSQSLTFSPDRYVAEQVAVFDLDVLTESAADVANEALLAQARTASGATVTVGGRDGVVVGIDGAVRLAPRSPAISVDRDGALAFSREGTATVDAEGTVRGTDGGPVLDRGGRPVMVGVGDVLVGRDDGLLIIVAPAGSLTVVSPSAQVVDVPAAPMATADDPGGGAGSAPAGGGAAGSEDQLRTEPDGTVILPFGPRAVRLTAGSRPVVVDASGTPLPVPGGTSFVGVDQPLLLLRDDGAAVARSDTETVVVSPDGQVAVLDQAGELTTGTSDVEVQGVGDAVARPVPLTSADINAGLSVTSRKDTNLITIGFSAASPEVALVGANAVVTAYERLQRSGDASANAAALARADDSLRSLSLELVDTERQLTNARLASPSRSELASQYDRILDELAAAGTRLLGATPADSAAAASRIRDLITQLDAINRVEQAETANPATAELVSRRDQLSTRMQQVQSQRDALSIDPDGGGSNIQLSSPAEDAVAIGGLGPLRLGFVGAVLGLFGGTLLAYALDLRRPTLESADEASEILAAPLLSEIPDFKHERIRSSLPILDHPTSHAAEAFRIAGATVLAIGLPAAADGDPAPGAVIGVVSAGVGDGKSTFAANLAVALAQTDRTVLAVDADLEGQVSSLLLRRHAHLGTPTHGLLDAVAGRDLVDCVQHVALDETGELDLVAAGPRALPRRGLLDTSSTSVVFDRASEAYEVSIVDVPPMLSVAYAAHVLRALDRVVVVVAAGSPIATLVEVRQRLDLLGIDVVGFVYNRAALRPGRTSSMSSRRRGGEGNGANEGDGGDGATTAAVPSNRGRWPRRRRPSPAATALGEVRGGDAAPPRLIVLGERVERRLQEPGPRIGPG